HPRPAVLGGDRRAQGQVPARPVAVRQGAGGGTGRGGHVVHRRQPQAGLEVEDSSMAQLVQALALGVLIGGIYALMASGLTLIFGVLHIINIAQGAFLILVATVTWWLWRTIGIDPILSAVITTPLMFGLGWVIYRFVVSRIRGQAPSMSVLLTFGLALVIEGFL